METVMAAGEHSSEKEEVTVIKGKVLRTEKVKKEDVHKEIRQAEKKEKAKKAKKGKKNALPVLTAEMPAPKAEPAAKAAPAKKADAPKVQPQEKAAVETAAKDTEAVKKAPEKPRFEDKRIEINLASRLLTLYQGDVGIRMYPIAPGKPSSPTPVGRRTVVDMEVNPTWVDPDSGTSIPSAPTAPSATAGSASEATTASTAPTCPLPSVPTPPTAASA